VKPKMDDSPIYQDDVVTVTRTRFVVRSQTYDLAETTSVSTRTKEVNRMWPTIMAGAGAILLFAGLQGGGTPSLVAGAIVGGMGFLWYRSLSVQYAIVLTTATGEREVLNSDDEDWISRVSEALNDSSVARG
jgi:hypothetical protein